MQSNSPIVYSVAAVNEIGTGVFTDTDPLIPLGDVNIPETPTNVIAVPYGLSAKLAWTLPGDGGSPITAIRIKAYPDTEDEKILFIYGSPTSYTFLNLSLNEKYRFTITAINEKGPSIESLASNPILISSTSPEPDLPNISSTEEINYKKFYIAPVELNYKSDNYLEYLYDKEVYEYYPSYIQGESIEWPVTIDENNNRFVFSIGDTEVDFTLANGNYSLDSLDTNLNIIDQLNDNAPLDSEDNPIYEATGLFDKVIITCKKRSSETGPYYNINLVIVQDNIEIRHLGHNSIFGLNPIIQENVATQVVSNYVPTVEYDTKNSRPYFQ